MQFTQKKKDVFQKVIWDYYITHGRRQLPWRSVSRTSNSRKGKNLDPYVIWVSEIMLQQTQVDRVIPFFTTWMKKFPTLKKLAEAPQSEILRLWKGLGYNSRALRMKKTAQIVCNDYGGIFPKTYKELLDLPGIGPYTAGAIMAFAYNEPVVMIETNIRRVFIHHFFSTPNIHDKQILELIEKTLPSKKFREWYWALMDYGSYLGKTIPNPNKKSRHYTVQKKFKGSDREIRGKILEILLLSKKLTIEKLIKKLDPLTEDHERIERIIDQLDHEGFLTVKHGSVILRS